MINFWSVPLRIEKKKIEFNTEAEGFTTPNDDYKCLNECLFYITEKYTDYTFQTQESIFTPIQTLILHRMNFPKAQNQQLIKP